MEDTPKRITVGLIVSWVLGVVFGIAGLVQLFSNPVTGLLMLLAAAILLPPVNRIMAQKMKFSLSGGLKFIVVLGLLIVSGITMSKSNTDIATNPKASESPRASTTPVLAEKVDVATFVGEFDKNQLAAEEKWKDKIIQFTGKVSNISEDITGTAFVIVQPRNADQYYFGTSIQCYFKSKSALTSLENGGVTTFQGKVDSQLMNVLVKDCQVITP